jgi:hypothetical protein
MGPEGPNLSVPTTRTPNWTYLNQMTSFRHIYSSFVGGAGFKSWPEYRLPWDLSWHPSGPLKQVPEYYRKSGSESYFHTIFNSLFNHLRIIFLYMVWANDRALKLISYTQRFTNLCTEYREIWAGLGKVPAESYVNLSALLRYMVAQSLLTHRKKVVTTWS